MINKRLSMKAFLLKQVIIIAFLMGIAFPINAQIVINEVLASNTSTNLDDKSKNFCDWIELYNNSDREISLGNWFLSDDIEKPNKWAIPFYVSIAPNGYKLFWADGINSSNHLNFKLDIDGETIYLFNGNLELIDSIKYPQQSPDISYGRCSGSPNQWNYFHEVTPNKINPLSGNNTLDFSKKPIFSLSSGFYQKLLKLKITCTDDSEKIFYTMDGSLPTQQSKEYWEPIEIKESSVIRARTYSKDKLPSKVNTQTFIISESFTLPTISLAVDPIYLWDQNIGIYVKGVNYVDSDWKSANYFQSWERPVNVEYFDIDGNSGFNIDAGVRIHGRSTRNFAQKSLAIFAREKYGTSSITYKLFGEQSPDTMKTFLLRNGGNDWGMTMFLDGLVHTLVMAKIDIDAQLYRPAIVFLNGKYWGIHNIREKVNEYYIKNKYPGISEDFDIVEFDNMVEKPEASYGSLDEYNKMIEFINHNKLSVKENYDTVKKWIDIDELTNYLITQIYIGNGDWPQNNLKLWKDQSPLGKWRWILYDTELSFRKSDEYTEYSMIEKMFAVNSDFYKTPAWSNYLIRNLFENEEFKNEFIQRMAIYVHTVFDSDHVFHVMDSLKRNIEPEITMNHEKWGGIKHTVVPYFATAASKMEWEANIEFITRYIESRPSDLRKKTMDYFNLKDTVSFKLGVSDQRAGKISLMGYTLNNGTFDGYVFTDVPIRLVAIPNEGYKFVKWKGGDYDRECSIRIDKNKKLTAVFEKIE